MKFEVSAQGKSVQMFERFWWFVSFELCYIMILVFINISKLEM